MKIRNAETITKHKSLSKTVTLLYIITKTVHFNYIRSSRRQVQQEIQPCIKDFPAWISDIARVEGMPEIQGRKFP